MSFIGGAFRGAKSISKSAAKPKGPRTPHSSSTHSSTSPHSTHTKSTAHPSSTSPTYARQQQDFMERRYDARRNESQEYDLKQKKKEEKAAENAQTEERTKADQLLEQRKEQARKLGLKVKGDPRRSPSLDSSPPNSPTASVFSNTGSHAYPTPASSRSSSPVSTSSAKTREEQDLEEAIAQSKRQYEQEQQMRKASLQYEAHTMGFKVKNREELGLITPPPSRSGTLPSGGNSPDDKLLQTLTPPPSPRMSTPPATPTTSSSTFPELAHPVPKRIDPQNWNGFSSLSAPPRPHDFPPTPPATPPSRTNMSHEEREALDLYNRNNGTKHQSLDDVQREISAGPTPFERDFLKRYNSEHETSFNSMEHLSASIISPGTYKGKGKSLAEAPPELPPKPLAYQEELDMERALRQSREEAIERGIYT